MKLLTFRSVTACLNEATKIEIDKTFSRIAHLPLFPSREFTNVSKRRKFPAVLSSVQLYVEPNRDRINWLERERNEATSSREDESWVRYVSNRTATKSGRIMERRSRWRNLIFVYSICVFFLFLRVIFGSYDDARVPKCISLSFHCFWLNNSTLQQPTHWYEQKVIR